MPQSLQSPFQKAFANFYPEQSLKTDLKYASAFLWAVKFLATFNLQIDITMDIF